MQGTVGSCGRALALSSLALAFAAGIAASVPRAAAASPDCAAAEAAGAALAPKIVAARNAEAAGAVHAIDQRRRLHLRSVQSLFLTGCEATVLSSVTLERDLKRDFNGLVTLSARAVRLTEDELCFGEVAFVRSSLAADLTVGITAYGWVAQASLPDHSCFAR